MFYPIYGKKTNKPKLFFHVSAYIYMYVDACKYLEKYYYSY